MIFLGNLAHRQFLPLAITGVALTALLLSISSCKSMAIKDGLLPQGGEVAAEAFSGVYQGRAYYKAGSGPYQGIHNQTVTVTFHGRQVALASSSDWIGDGCGSSLGPLVWLEISDDLSTINRAQFVFNPGRCGSKVAGRTLTLNTLGRTLSGQHKMYYWISTSSGPETSVTTSSDYVGSLVHVSVFGK